MPTRMIVCWWKVFLLITESSARRKKVLGRTSLCFVELSRTHDCTESRTVGPQSTTIDWGGQYYVLGCHHGFEHSFATRSLGLGLVVFLRPMAVSVFPLAIRERTSERATKGSSYWQGRNVGTSSISYSLPSPLGTGTGVPGSVGCGARNGALV